MADDVQIRFGADVDSAISGISALKNAVGDLVPAISRLSAAALRSFQSAMQVMVDQKQITTRQALGFDIDYTAQLHNQDAERLQALIASNVAMLDDKVKAVQQLAVLDADYTANVAENQRRIADLARTQAEAVERSYEQAFDRIGGSLTRTFNELLTRQTTWAKASTQLVQQVETIFLEEIETIAAKWAASGLASLVGGGTATAVSGAQATGGSGLAAGLMSLIGLNQPGGLFGTGFLSGTGGAAQATAITANTTALTASTTAIASLTAALTGAAATSGAAAAGGLGAGAAAAGTAAGGGGVFGWLGGLFGFARGGIVPSAAGGWALPSFPGATPALLHAREMVLPASISEGLQDMIGRGAGGADQHFHAHFHGPADAPAISRWFRDNMRQNAVAIRDMFRQNALTPRNL